MPGRGDKAQPEPLEVIERIVQRVDFELAAVTRAGIDLADRQAAAEPRPGRPIDVPGKLGERRLVRTRCRLGERALDQALEQDSAHCVALFHDLFRKPVTTFRDHAPYRSWPE
jgi:hypothetical protein